MYLLPWTVRAYWDPMDRVNHRRESRLHVGLGRTLSPPSVC
jgi:hypothetical protein